jgi:LacI family transcriptional regulator
MARTTVRMKDIAEKVGVSRTAVSFVLNGIAREKGVSQKLERKIKRVAKALNYRPSLLAKSLVNEKTMTIGVIFPKIASVSTSKMLKEIDVQAQGKDYQVMLTQHENDKKRLITNIDNLLGRHVDGLLITPTASMDQAELYEELKKTKKPVVFVNHDPSDPAFNVVTVDAGGAVEMSMQHLHKLGHKRIALFNATKEFSESKRRDMAYKMFCEDYGLGIDPNLIIYPEWDPDKGIYQDNMQGKLKKLISIDSPPTAIIATSSVRGIEIYQQAEAMGLKIPEDVSLVILTGLEFNGFHKAHITSAKFSYEQIGSVAFNLLLDIIQNLDNPPRKTYLPATFVKGNTTTSPKIS